MARKYLDCRDYPSDKNCTVAMSADTENELMETAVQHACATHGHMDSPELRESLRQLFKEGMPAEEYRKAA